MNFKTNFVLWCVLLLTKQCVLTEVGECVQRRQGACKVLQLDHFGKIDLKDFHSPQPDGFSLKTSIEINLSENKHSYENNLSVEKKRKIGYNLDNAAIVTIRIWLDGYERIEINLGKKYYRLAGLQYHGTFSVYADVNTEPFLQCQLANRPIVHNIEISAPPDQTDLIAFVDCSEKHKPNCGSQRVDRLYGCREWMVERNGVSYIHVEGFQKTYEKGVLFDEFVVVDIADYSSRMLFYFSDGSRLIIEFMASSIKAEIYILRGGWILVKGAVTTKWTQIPASPYAVRIQLPNDTDNNSLKISNIGGSVILTLNLCEAKGSLETIQILGARFHFDCLHPYHKRFKMMNERPRKTNEKDDLDDLTYHKNGYNFSKPFLDTRHYVSEPFVLYTHTFGNSTKDWCYGEVKPELFVSSKGNDDPLQSVIKSSNKALLSELEKVNAQLNATADTNKALLSKLEKSSNASAEIKRAIVETNKAVADTNKAILSELQSVKASIHLNEILRQSTIITIN